MGICEYILAQDVLSNRFKIRQTNEPCGGGQRSCTRSLKINFPYIEITLLRGSVLVNGTAVSPQYDFATGGESNIQCRKGTLSCRS